MATFTPAVKSVCLKTRQLVLLLIGINFISDGTCQKITLDCPTLQECSVTKFNCSVPTSICQHSSVFFQFESKDGTPSILCQASSSSPCNQQPEGGMTCGCVLSNTGFRNYQLNFLGNKATHNEGNLTCNANCIIQTDGAVCQTLKFANSRSNMHVIRTGIVASMSGIIVLISTHLN